MGGGGGGRGGGGGKSFPLEVISLRRDKRETNTLQHLYNTVRYNTAMDITRFKDGSQNCIDYIEK